MADFEEMHRAYYNAMKPLIDNFLPHLVHQIEVPSCEELGFPSNVIFLNSSQLVSKLLSTIESNRSLALTFKEQGCTICYV